MATVNLRLTGVMPLHALAAAVSAWPIAYVGWLAAARHAAVGTTLVLGSAVVAVLPWLSRAVARTTYRAKCDEVAVHVRGEALPYRMITSLSVEKNARRTTLTIHRGETVRIELVLRDAFAGRLEPLDELVRRLAAHGHNLPN
jgi:hypothetical protein